MAQTLARLDISRGEKLIQDAAFILLHLFCFAAIWTGVSLGDLVLCLVLYLVRMFGVTAGYHRYFSHRSYKMGRAMQFLMACLAMTSAQQGVLWWAAHHRHHHKHSDKPEDVHSPRRRGFWYSHMGWILSRKWSKTEESRVRDLLVFPELRWLNHVPALPATALGVAVFFLFGWSGLVVGFLWSTVLVWHNTFIINSLTHVIGTQRYDTGDDSRNHWLLALLTLGEGWHNNHHHYQSSARQGFFWWEIDITFACLKVLNWTGLVWNLREPPQHVIDNQMTKG